MWAEALPEIVPAVVWEEESKVVGSGVMVLEHSPAGPPLVPLLGCYVHPQSGGLGLLLGYFEDGVYLLVLLL